MSGIAFTGRPRAGRRCRGSRRSGAPASISAYRSGLLRRRRGRRGNCRRGHGNRQRRGASARRRQSHRGADAGAHQIQRVDVAVARVRSRDLAGEPAPDRVQAGQGVGRRGRADAGQGRSSSRVQVGLLCGGRSHPAGRAGDSRREGGLRPGQLAAGHTCGDGGPDDRGAAGGAGGGHDIAVDVGGAVSRGGLPTLAEVHRLGVSRTR